MNSTEFPNVTQIQRELIEMGFDIILINKIFNRFNIISLQQAVEFLVKVDGMWNHPFVSISLVNMNDENSNSVSKICEICNDLIIAHRSNINPAEIFKKREENKILSKTYSNKNLHCKPNSLNNDTDSVVSEHNYSNKSEKINLTQSNYQNIFDQNKNSVIKFKETILTCGICLSQLTDPAKLPCEENFCSACLMEYLNFKINSSDVENIKCPNFKCPKEFIFNEELLKSLTDDTLFLKYLKFKRRISILKNPNLIICPIIDCESFAYKLNYDNSENREIELKIIDNNESNNKQLNANLINENMEKTIFKCINNHEFCIKCGQMAHIGINCEKKIENEFFKYVDLENVKTCPKCGFYIKKSAGCNHMTCANKSCKFEFCWICLAEYRVNHYSNPLNGCLGLAYANDGDFLVKFKFLRYIRTVIYIIGVVILFSSVIAFPSVAMAIGFIGNQGAEMNANFHPIMRRIVNPMYKKLAKILLYSLYLFISIALLPLSYLIIALGVASLPLMCLCFLFIDFRRLIARRRRPEENIE